MTGTTLRSHRWNFRLCSRCSGQAKVLGTRWVSCQQAAGSCIAATVELM